MQNALPPGKDCVSALRGTMSDVKVFKEEASAFL